MNSETIEIEVKTTKNDFYPALEKSVFAALETYSNVHRGSGHFSMVTTHLFDEARKKILQHFGLSKGKYKLIFCTPRRAEILTAKFNPPDYQLFSSQDYGLPIGLRALAVKKNVLPRGVPFQTGGGSARLISRDWVVWESAPDRFESGTPAIVNVIAFARALQLIGQSGDDIFKNPGGKKLSAADILYHDEFENHSGRELLEKLRRSLIGSSVFVPTADGERPFINMDYAASTPAFSPVWEAVRQTWRQPEKVQKEIVREVGSVCAKILGAPASDYDIIFTSNTTESINLAAESIGREAQQEFEPVILTTLLEHSSNDLPWRNVPNHSHVTLPIDGEGFINVVELDQLMRDYNQDGKFGKKRITLLAMSGASNVLGTFNDLAEISRIVHKYGARLLVDAAQLVAHRKVDMEKSGIDYLAFSAHKVYAPFGTGVLVVKKGLLRFNSGEMDLIHSSGEENVAGIAALGKTLLLLQRVGLDVIEDDEQELTRLALAGLLKIPEIQIYGITDHGSQKFVRKGSVIVFNLKNKMSDVVAKGLAQNGGIGIRYGCHCSHVLIKHLLGVGPKLERFQKFIVTVFPRVQLPGVARVSFGIGNTKEEVDRMIKTLNEIAENHSKSKEKVPDEADPVIPVLSKAEVKKQIKDFVKSAEARVFAAD